MSDKSISNWYEFNQQYLMAAVDVVRQYFEAYLDALEGKQADWKRKNAGKAAMRKLHTQSSQPSALDTLGDLFGLSEYERDVLLLCAGVELEPSIMGLCAQIDSARPYPTFGMTLSVFPHAHWSALVPNAPLRSWGLIELGSGSTLTYQRLRIDERILHYLTGVSHLDQRLQGYFEELYGHQDLVPSHESLAKRLIHSWSSSEISEQLPYVQLCGKDIFAKRAITYAACEEMGMTLYRMDVTALPLNIKELSELIRLWEREASLSGSALLLECDRERSEDVALQNAISRMIESIHSPLVVSTHERRRTQGRRSLNLDVDKPTPKEQQAIWNAVLGEDAGRLNGTVQAITSHFDLSSVTIQAVYADAVSQPSADEELDVEDFAAELWRACSRQTQPQLEDLAQRIDPIATWDDLVLPEPQRRVLREIALHVRARTQVYDDWGFRNKGLRGLGISALFAGTSGTGKTMAAEVLANELNLDLYIVDLSQVVSKYIGETEKNLARVFDVAEDGGAILLFDEADALFGKRSEVKDSHDRYANIEVSYLLQRMEAYRGLAILTTNMKKSLDDAFLRRIRFIVQFPFPEASARAEIWRRIFPPQTPTQDLDEDKLAQLSVPGGNIRNIALNAAFLAADDGEPVGMMHLARAARSEYAKLEKTVSDTELRGWM